MVKNDHAIKEYEELNRSSEAGINGIRDLLMKEQGQKMKLAGLLENFKEKHREVKLEFKFNAPNNSGIIPEIITFLNFWDFCINYEFIK